MIHNFVQNIGGIGNFGVISICLFFIVFTGAVTLVFLLRKSFLTRMESLPLHDGEINSTRKGDVHE